MTETEWQTTTTKPAAMLKFVEHLGRRKNTLVRCAVARLVWEWVPEDPYRRAVEAAEAVAEGHPADAAVYRALRRAHVDHLDRLGEMSNSQDPTHYARMVAAAAVESPPASRAAAVEWLTWAAEVTAPPNGQTQARKAVRRRVCELCREVFGNPFSPRQRSPEWLGGGFLEPGGRLFRPSDAAKTAAAAIAETRNYGELPILADLLDDDGCGDADLVAHLRHGEDHAPGCWALDLVAGRG